MSYDPFEKYKLTKDQQIAELHKAARRILRDECPDDPHFYYCLKNEDYDPDACMLCWENYLIKI